MAKRFTATEIWSEDWFLDMPIEYKLFWYYMLSTCNHAGFFKVNLRSFCGLNEVKLTPTNVLEYFNAGKERIRVINNSLWLIDDFFVYQYGTTLNPNNRVHASIVKEYLKHGIELTSIRGLKDLKEGVKDKDKDKDKNNINVNDFKLELVYSKSWEDYKIILNGHSDKLSEIIFIKWKEFVDFIRKNNYTEIFKAKFVTPIEFGTLMNDKKFLEPTWKPVIEKILSTGVKPEHILFYRIPEFMEYVKNKTHGKSTPSTVGKTITFDRP